MLTYDLPFAEPRARERRGALPVSFWTVRATGDQGRDRELGRDLAAKALACMQEERLPALLTWVVRDMVEAGRFGGVEAGFLAAVAEAVTDGRVQ